MKKSFAGTLVGGSVVFLLLASLILIAWPVLTHQPPILVPNHSAASLPSQPHHAVAVKSLPEGESVTFTTNTGSTWKIEWQCRQGNNFPGIFWLMDTHKQPWDNATFPCTDDGLKSAAEKFKNGNQGTPSFIEMIDQAVADFIALLK